MSYPPFNRIARNDEDPRYHDVDPPDEMDNAVKCSCGGAPTFHTARNRGDVSHIACSGCDRIIPVAEGRSTEEAVNLWNQRVKEDLCQKHSWMLQPDDGRPCKPTYRCVFCNAFMI